MTELDTLKEKFNQTSEKNKLPLIEKIVAQGEDGYQFLREFLNSCEGEVTPTMGTAFLILKRSEQQVNDDLLKGKIS